MNVVDAAADPRWTGPTLGYVVRVYWKHKGLLIGLAILGVVAALVYLSNATYTYTGTLKVVPAQSSLQEPSGNLAGLASIAGINLSPDRTPPFQLYQRALRERVVADVLARDPSIMQRAFKGRWDISTRRWKTDKGAIFEAFDAIKLSLGLPVYPLGAPDGEDLLRFINARAEIEVDPRSSMATITFQHADPLFARDILVAMHRAADGYLRRRVLAQASEHVRYLQETLRSVTVAEHRTALTQVLSDQEKLLMTARARGGFAADPFGDATVSSRPTRPSPILVLFAGLLSGLLVGAAAVLLRSGLWKAFDPSAD